jgi:hypothetical protein
MATAKPFVFLVRNMCMGVEGSAAMRVAGFVANWAANH